MKVINNNGYRFEYLKKYEKKLHQPYDYRTNGLLNKILSHKVHQTKNPILKQVLNIYEKNIEFMMSYVDILQNFFNYNWKNR